MTNLKPVVSLFCYMAIFFLLPGCSKSAETGFTRGLGIYPGDPGADFSLDLVIDNTTYRNIALRRPVYQSSSYDYNLTGQLVTDGIKTTTLPNRIVVSSSQQENLKKNEREWLIDHHFLTSVNVAGGKVWVQIALAGANDPLAVDRVDFNARIRTGGKKKKGWQAKVLGSDDGLAWQELGMVKQADFPGELLPITPWRPGPDRFRMLRDFVKLKKPAQNRFYRVEFSAPVADFWYIGDLDFYRNDKLVELAPSHTFTSVWMSAGNTKEWLYIDLGAVCTFDKINLYWIRRATAGAIQVSNDASRWRDIQDLSASAGLTDEFKFEPAVSTRYVRLLLTQPASPEGYLLSEMEIFGRGGPVARPKTFALQLAGNRLNLAGGNWKIQRASLVAADGASLAKTGYDDSNWLSATVPGTALVSYLNAGVLPDPNFGDNQLLISESFFNSDFWYRDEFEIPPSFTGRHIFLNFDGINWKAEIYLNGHSLGRIEGAFMAGKFDISGYILPGKNALAVRIEKNANPGNVKEQTYASPDRNGGALGADNPTFHATVGWDWIPTIRGRDAGIWNDVYLTASGPVTIEDPFITTDLPLPDTTKASVNIEVSLQNHDTVAVDGFLSGSFGDAEFRQPVVLAASELKTVKLDVSTHPQLRLQNPKLWWPNGYGKQNLYDVNLKFETEDSRTSDIKSLLTGVREMSYDDASGALKIYVNGRRFVGRGGNWGFPEALLRYRAREYDVAVRYHKDMNFTMIRNWVGQTGDEEFYEACDRYGIMIWQDFWLANPVDGPNPYDNVMFMANVEDYVKRIRNHPAIALYCGRNEGNPPEELDSAIRAVLPKIHPGLQYISHSAEGTVSGYGPYRAMPVDFYFKERATTKLHSELGMPNVMTYESLQATMPESAHWPIGRMWGVHDFCQGAAMGGATFVAMVNKGFGEINNAKDWTTFAQWINYNGYRAMYEAQGKNRMGLVIWMSHPAWPSFVWQTYDYYFEPTAAYFGAKKACEPLHIQWNALTDSVEVVNYSAGDFSGLAASAELLNLDGSLKWQKADSLENVEDTIVRCFKMEYPGDLSDVFFTRLKLHKADELLSENFYWCGREEGNYQALRTLPKVKVDVKTKINRDGDKWLLTTKLHNRSDYPALMLRLKVVRGKSGDRILPVLYSDNYVALMPGENRTISMELAHADTRGEKPLVEVSGFNLNSEMESN